MAFWTYENLIEGCEDEGTGFLVERFNTTTGQTTYALQAYPARKNLSMRQCLRGWCGETNNISVSALGLGRVVRRCKNGRVMLARVRATKEALTALGYPGLADE